VIALIDYRAGNLTSVKKALATIGADVFVPEAPGDLADATGIIVPGVGHFRATRALDQSWIDAILARVGEGRPLFGICLGMQWLYEGSDEATDCPGLGLFSGRCYRLGKVRSDTTEGTSGVPDATKDTDNARDSSGVRLPLANTRGRQSDQAIKIPHVGWNSLSIERGMSIVEGVPAHAQVYFTHSYAAPLSGETVAVTEHGGRFAAIVQRGHVAGVQFHPEKSGDIGLRILRNFLELVG
jgi:imidazole glycerol-phosphate synthase subunit HisH